MGLSWMIWGWMGIVLRRASLGTIRVVEKHWHVSGGIILFIQLLLGWLRRHRDSLTLTTASGDMEQSCESWVILISWVDLKVIIDTCAQVVFVARI